jgi:hypothetical protein
MMDGMKPKGLISVLIALLGIALGKQLQSVDLD